MKTHRMSEREELGMLIDKVTADRDRLRSINAQLLGALKKACECIDYCRKAHKDVQSGSGFPIEVIWNELIARAEGRP